MFLIFINGFCKFYYYISISANFNTGITSYKSSILAQNDEKIELLKICIGNTWSTFDVNGLLK
jgi:hypothetical protein